MFKHYLKISWRNVVRSKSSSIINISGLAGGMTVAVLIGLWIYDELQFDKYHANYDRIVQVMQHQTFNGEISTQSGNPSVMAKEIRTVYGSDFKYVLQSSWNMSHILAYGDKIFIKKGSYFEPEVTEMLSLKMLKGSRDGLRDMNSILLSASAASAIFGKEDPMNKIIRVFNKTNVAVAGVYEDLPDNTSFKDMQLIMPWSLYVSLKWVKEMENPWKKQHAASKHQPDFPRARSFADAM